MRRGLILPHASGHQLVWLPRSSMALRVAVAEIERLNIIMSGQILVLCDEFIFHSTFASEFISCYCELIDVFNLFLKYTYHHQ